MSYERKLVNVTENKSCSTNLYINIVKDYAHKQVEMKKFWRNKNFSKYIYIYMNVPIYYLVTHPRILLVRLSLV